MTRLEVLLEEPSAKEALEKLLPQILKDRARFKVINLGSKHKLLKVLEDRLRAYRKRIDNGEPLRLLVLVDRDNDECERLKADLENMAVRAGMPTKSQPDADARFLVVNRVVVEELESWFIGDPEALRKAFPKLPAIDPKKGIFRNPDNGGTWEALHRYLKGHGIYKSSYQKIDAARWIAPKMDVERNRSRSFRAFVEGVEAALG